MSDNQRFLILCIGNSLLLDEGFAPRVAEELLARYTLPSEVTVLDRGVMGMAMLTDLRQADQVLVIDALDNTGEPPGTVFQFKPDDLAERQIFHGAHDVRLIDVLNAASLLGITPEVNCLGAQVQSISPHEFQIGLTESVQAAVPLVIDQIVGWLSSHGITLTQH
ncbi:MAG: hydrogenase maturation protease [Coriobacteriia bacterium]|nr:hydrogenase maturation protease [Coriobacteriia bacterium]